MSSRLGFENTWIMTLLMPSCCDGYPTLHQTRCATRFNRRRSSRSSTNAYVHRYLRNPEYLLISLSSQLSGVAPRQVGNLAPGALPSSIVPRNFRKVKFMDIEPLELARQLTIMDGRLFAKITPQECLGKAWPKEYGSEAPNISAMIDMSNAVSPD